jgi:uncharacterized protein YlxP (DUF503 family)
MYAAALRVELRIPEARSLKEKRRVLQSVVSELRNRMSLSVAEIDHHDEWQRSTVGVAIVAGGNTDLENRIAAVKRMLGERVDLELLEIVLSYLEDPE